MICSILTLSRRRWAEIIFAAMAIAVGACSGNPWDSSVTPTAPSHSVAHAKPDARATPIAWATWMTVDDTALTGANNEITGIEDGNWIVGVNFGNSSDSAQSFVAVTPSPASTATGFVNFRPLNVTSASVTYLWGRADSSRGGEAGYIVPLGGSYSCNPCGVTHGGSGWTIINNPAAGSCNNTTVRGIDSSWMTVGFYLSGSGCGTAAPFEEYTESACCSSGHPSTVFAAFKPPGSYSGAVATGVNGLGDVVGYTTSNGASTGWYYSFFQYTPIRVPYATSTQPIAIDWQDDVVGEYWDASGGPYGFLVQHPSGVALYQYPIYFQGNSKYSQTVPASINDCANIAGWYLNPGSGVFNGFVATTAAKDCPVGKGAR